MNILSFDIEEWFIEKAFHGGRTDQYDKFDRYLDGILELLESKACEPHFLSWAGWQKTFPKW